MPLIYSPAAAPVLGACLLCLKSTPRPPSPSPLNSPASEKLRLWEDEIGWGKSERGMERNLWLLGKDGGRIWRCTGMDEGRAGAHYGDLGGGESTRCRQWPWTPVWAADKSAFWLYLHYSVSARECTQNAVSVSSVLFNPISDCTTVNQQVDLFPCLLQQLSGVQDSV